MKKLGIVGGASWNSTALYYEHINKGVAARLGGLHSARLVIESLDCEDDYAGFHRRGDWAGGEKIVIQACERLRDAGAEGLILTSNTMHKHYDAVAAALPLPVLHIGEAAAERIAADGRRTVALLGTRVTMIEPHVRSHFEARGITLAPIEDSWVGEVDRIIYEELAAGRVVRESQRKLKTLITELGKKRVEAIVLGCTELVLAVDPRANVLPVYDTTAIHARKAVEWILSERENGTVAAAA
ncbi:aspartate/glutamate racemase family protein [Sphingomonas sp. LHG3443-2]|uniref:aspartate/glutamate racemase family protein n=1 Tax=Sphingomonas sp. LHG3443-2 TaxID=2804639 RepID=UPI003CF83E83